MQTLEGLYDYVAKNQNDVKSFLENITQLIDIPGPFLEREEFLVSSTP